MHGFPTDKKDRCVFAGDSRREVIFFEKNKVLGVEANRVLNILEEIKNKNKHDLKRGGGGTRGSVGCGYVARISFCFKET